MFPDNPGTRWMQLVSLLLKLRRVGPVRSGLHSSGEAVTALSGVSSVGTMRYPDPEVSRANIAEVVD